MNNFFSVTTIARHLISVTLLTGAATAMVAGSASPADTTMQRADQATGNVRNEHGDQEELYGLVKACIESHEKTSEACQKAIAASGLSPEEFYARVAANFEAKKKHETTRPETPSANADVEALVKECIERYMNASKTGEGASDAKEVCLRAIEASGLTPEEFFKKFLQREPRPETTKKPETPSTNADLEALVKDCIAKYTAAYKTEGTGMAAKEVCMRAIAATGLTPEEFFKKFLPRTERKPEVTPQPKPESMTELLKKCVTLAAALNGDSSGEDVEKTAAVCAKAKAIFDH